jgi:hypothetical protein
MSESVQVLYFYRTKWGAHDEFVALFRKNHWPILREDLANGRFVDVRMATPRFHGDGRADWDVLVSITYRDWAAMEAHTRRPRSPSASIRTRRSSRRRSSAGSSS